MGPTPRVSFPTDSDHDSVADFGLSFYGVAGTVSGDDPAVVEDLRRDFQYFAAEDRGQDFKVRLFRQPPPKGIIPQNPAMVCGSQYIIYQTGLVRVVDYHGAALARIDFAAESCDIYSEDIRLLRELGYLVVLSRAGYLLDLKGLHRVHALGVVLEGRGTLVLLPSGGGKTTLMMDLLKEKSVGLLSDDTPLVSRSGRLYPFPLRFGLLPDADLTRVPADYRRTFWRRQYGKKILVDLPFFQESISDPVSPGLIIVGQRTAAPQPQRVQALRASGIVPLLSSLVVGLGTPQLAEYMMRWDAAGLAALTAIAASRTLALTALLIRCPVARLFLSADRDANKKAFLSCFR